jgi:hypothetical protein
LNHEDSRTASKQFDPLVTVRDRPLTAQCFGLINEQMFQTHHTMSGDGSTQPIPLAGGEILIVSVGVSAAIGAKPYDGSSMTSSFGVDVQRASDREHSLLASGQHRFPETFLPSASRGTARRPALASRWP